jgi:hypothetical protein
MKKILLMVAVALMTAMSAQAQKIQIVDNDGNAIPLVSVLTEDGIYIGTTGFDGVLADVKGAARVAVTHVAYKPQLVTVAELQGGRITMEDIDYGLDEVVVKPKPYLYVEYYYRAFSYIGDSLRVYTAGILPIAHDIQNKYKGKVQGYWAFGGAANKALTWNTQSMEDNVQGLAEGAAWPVEKWLDNNQKYVTTIEPEGDNSFVIKNPEEVVGRIVNSDGLSYATLDVDRMRIYGERTNGNEKVAKVMENRNYTYRYTEVFRLDDEGKVLPENFVMQQIHLEYDKKEGRKVNVAYLYAVDKGYMNKDEAKARGKEINKGRKGDMSLDELAAYERAHNIPALSPEQQKAILTLTKQTGKKK